MDLKDTDQCSYVFDKPEPIMLSVLPIIPYPKFISIILNLLIPKPSPFTIFFKILVCQPTVI